MSAFIIDKMLSRVREKRDTATLPVSDEGIFRPSVLVPLFDETHVHHIVNVKRLVQFDQQSAYIARRMLFIGSCVNDSQSSS
jgi:hypothetical protein